MLVDFHRFVFLSFYTNIFSETQEKKGFIIITNDEIVDQFQVGDTIRSNGNAEESINFNALNVYFICHVTALYKKYLFRC